MTKVEHDAIHELIRIRRKQLLKKTPNSGVQYRETRESAGPDHLSLPSPLIPRREGDLEDPRGGVRGVIPEKMNTNGSTGI